MDNTHIEKVNLLVKKAQEWKSQINDLTNERDTLRKLYEKECAQNRELQAKYSHLQAAKAWVSLSKGDISKAKKQLAELVEEIDICIEALNNGIEK